MPSAIKRTLRGAAPFFEPLSGRTYSIIEITDFLETIGPENMLPNRQMRKRCLRYVRQNIKKGYMTRSDKQLSNPFSTGGGGVHFEAHVQASFVVLMLTGGFAPCMPNWPISKIKLQGKFAGYDTDDLIVFVEG